MGDSSLTCHSTDNKHRIGNNYSIHGDKYNFSGPKPIPNIIEWGENIWKKNNLSVNIYGLEKHFQPSLKLSMHNCFPIKNDQRRERGTFWPPFNWR
jgi:hypothetical protein